MDLHEDMDTLSALLWQTSHVTLSRDMCTWLVCHDGADRESRALIVRQRESCTHDSFMCTWVMCTYREATWQNDSCILYMIHVVSRYVHMTRVTKILYVTWLILYVTWLILNMTCLVCHDGADRVSCAQFARQRESYAHDWVMCTWLMCTYRETTWRHSFVTMERIKSHVHMLRDNVSHVHMTESCAHESCAHIARQRDSWDMKTSARNMFIMSLNESF